MINVIAVDSIRTLPFAASLGFSLLFYYLIAALLFFIPSAMVSAELGTGWPTRGGIYIWVREAFGGRWSFVVIWLNWIYNIVWYPTIMAIIAASIAYFINPELISNRAYMASTIIILFWLATYANFHGMRISSIISIISAIIGTLLPMIFILSLGIYWLSRGFPTAIDLSFNSFIPTIENFSDLSYLSNILFGLLGLEMVATHAHEMINPEKDYPRAQFISVILILATIVLAALSISIIVEPQKLNLVQGTLQAFQLFFSKLGIPWMIYFIAGAMVIGGLGSVGAWIIGPPKGLLEAAHDSALPPFLTKSNKDGVPINVLFLQGGIVTLLSLLFIFMPSVNSSFWVLSIITAQLALIVYIFLFASMIKLHYHKPHIKRSYKIPGNSLGIWIVSLAGILICLFATATGFIPPSMIKLPPIAIYESILILGVLFSILLPLVIYKKSNRPKQKKL